ncbi:MAG: rubrerythrin [Velocimicrobium sp.]
MELKDSKTYENLQKAFDGELKASTKYAIYAEKAREDGYQQIGNIFDTTAENEREHAQLWLKSMEDGEIPDTLDNLIDAIKGESYEWKTMYPEFARVAKEEGFESIATLFEEVGTIERHHDFRYERLKDNIEDNTVFCKQSERVWICLNCGNIAWGECAPDICPVCGYPQGYYELFSENI